MPDHPRGVAVCTVALLLTLVPSAGASARQDRVERRVVRDVNQQRLALGLPSVHARHSLAVTAERHSRAMARYGRLTHGAFARRVDGPGGHARCGETLAFLSGGRGLADRVVAAWMASPEHREILLAPDLHHIGVGRSSGRNGWFFTADLAGR